MGILERQKEGNYIHLGIKVPKQLKDKIEEIAYREKKTVSLFVRELIEKEIQKRASLEE